MLSFEQCFIYFLVFLCFCGGLGFEFCVFVAGWTARGMLFGGGGLLILVVVVVVHILVRLPVIQFNTIQIHVWTAL